jgi:hypothetical protein
MSRKIAEHGNDSKYLHANLAGAFVRIDNNVNRH